MKLFGIAGWSGSGKTELITSLIPLLNKGGYSVSTIKHAHHTFDVDTPGKDSHRHRAAGASEVLVTSKKRWALMHETRNSPEMELKELVNRLTPVDLVLVEGFKREALDKLEVFRVETGKGLLQPDDPHIVAVASNIPITGLSVPFFNLDAIAEIASFIVTHCKINIQSSDFREKGH